MRDAISWFAAAAVAFFVTAGAFLLLANLGGSREEQPLSRPRPTESGPLLRMELREDQLENLEHAPDQRLEVDLSNTGAEPISSVNATVKVASENTAVPETRFYRAVVDKLKADETKTVGFEVDLSSFEYPTDAGLDPAAGPPRTILEVRATTPRGASAIKTAVLPP